MKKKFLAMYALVGAMVASPVFTSCIDDTESASVSAVRNAKAEQIKAATAASQAQAEYQAKMNEYNLLEKQWQHEQAQMDHEIAKMSHETNKLNAEKALLQAQKAIIDAENALIGAQDDILSTLATNYTTALTQVNTLNGEIFDVNSDITELKLGLIDVQAYAKKRSTELNNLIAEAEAAIEIYKNAEILDDTEITAKLAELENAKNVTLNKYNELALQYGSTKFDYAKNAQNVPSTNLATIEALRYLYANDMKDLYKQDAEGFQYLVEEKVAEEKQTLAKNVKTEEVKLANAVAELGTEADKKEATYYDATSAINVQTKYAALAEAQEAYAAAEKAYNEKNDAVEKAKKVVADAKTAYNAADKALTENKDEAKVEALTKAKNDAYDVLDKANKALETAEKALTQEIKDDYSTTKGELATAEKAVLTAKDNIADYEKTLAKAQKSSENFEAAIAAFAGEDYEVYKEAVVALEAALKAKNLASAEYTALNSIKSNYVSVAEKIAEEEYNIAGYKVELENITVTIKENVPTGSNSSTTGGTFSEAEINAIVTLLESRLEILEAKLEVEQLKLDNAKAALDAYLATDEEGGEAEA